MSRGPIRSDLSSFIPGLACQQDVALGLTFTFCGPCGKPLFKYDDLEFRRDSGLRAELMLKGYRVSERHRREMCDPSVGHGEYRLEEVPFLKDIVLAEEVNKPMRVIRI